MDEDVQPQPVKQSSFLRRAGIYAAVLIVVFLLGLVPMWIKSRVAASSLATAEHQLNLARIQNALSAAVIDARRGDYEPARQAASQFFTSLGAEVDKGEASNFNTAEREGMKPLFARRDEIITLLARSDPAAADKLSDLYVAFRKLSPLPKA
ncbi:MAG TPA: hypothetical protein VMS31_16130 [Pyrinomonadaceae bacterium]|nr:hypothetical protein [Pyrinomonadaceae bacterium]